MGLFTFAMKLIIYTVFFLLFIGSCNSKDKSNFVNVNKQIEKRKNNKMESLPIHGILNKEKLNLHYPGITDTINDLRIVGSEKLNLNFDEQIIVSILHNTATFDQMILCTHDKSYNLIDNFYIGKSTQFDKTSHTIDYNILNENTIKFDHVDWGYIIKNNDYEIDTLKHYSYILNIDKQRKINISSL